MRILIDECIDERFRNYLPGHDCQTARYAGLAGLKNGEFSQQLSPTSPKNLHELANRHTWRNGVDCGHEDSSAPRAGRNGQDVERGPYQSVDEFIEHAISLLHEQEAWLAEHGSEIRTKIEQGYAAAQRGELIGSDHVRSSLEEKKRVWLADKRQA
jgi:Arc/MetJ-type ribon-helix-helix transcriptional regulator